MANITIYDLQESFELDKKALAKLLGGRGYRNWTKMIDSRFTGKKKHSKHFFYLKNATYRQYK